MRSLCLTVPKEKGEPIRKKLLDMEVLRKDLIIREERGNLLLPIKEKVDLGFKIEDRNFEEVGRRIKSYREIAEVPEELRDFLPTSYDVIGEIAVLKIPGDLEGYERAIGEAFLKANKAVRTVVADKGVEGEFRIRNVKVIAGSPDFRTLHKEYGLCFLIDISQAYFSPRLSTERWRVTQKVRRGETVVDMFCGVGPFSIMIAKYGEPRIVYGIDSNQKAIEFFKENIRRNKVENVVPFLGDARDLLRRISGSDRIIMDLPRSSFDYFEDAFEATKDEGTIHYYEILETQAIEERIADLEKKAERKGGKIEIEERREVRAYSPSQKHFAFDLKVFSR